MFENVKRTRDLDLPNLNIDQKWTMVYNHEQIRQKEEERARNEQTKRQAEAGQSAAAQIIPETPEWYIRKFIEKTVTPKQVGSLLVSLRSGQLRYVSKLSVRSVNVDLVIYNQLVSSLCVIRGDGCAGADHLPH